MAQPRNQTVPDITILDTFGVAIRKNKNDIHSLRNIKRPTAPIYDSNNFPSNPVVGQYAVSLDNNFWIYGTDHQWHKTGIQLGVWQNVGDPGKPPFQNGWGNDPLINAVTRYRDIGNGVELQMNITGGVANTVVFTLPTLLAPDYDLPEVGVAGIADQATSKWRIRTTGDVALIRVDI